MAYENLKQLNFVDLYICIEGEGKAHYRVNMKGLTKHPDIIVPEFCYAELEQLAAYIRANINQDRLIVRLDGLRLRAAFIHEANGKTWVALRRIKEKPPGLDQLGYPAAIVPHLEKLGMREGLILICGATGQGKTTTGCALLTDFLRRYGGIGYTIEDPVEYDLSGKHGDSGFCYQVEVKRDNEWADGLVNALRCHPRYLFIGEVCTPDIANQLLRAATSGHLVITTIHAGSVFEGIEGLLQLAEQRIGERAKQLLATSFTAVFHQTLSERGVNLRFLVADNGTQSMGIRSLIRENKIGQLASTMDQQHAQLMLNGHIFR
jgi:twitching motility protein PilT